MPPARLFVLGAGFSRPAGLPLGIELLKLVRQNLTKSDFSQQLERDILAWNRLYPDEPVNLERILACSYRQHHLRLSGPDEALDHASLSINNVQKEIQRILIELTPVDNAIPALYQEFAERLTPHDVLLTFNYDTLLEGTLDSIGKPYTLVPNWWLENAGRKKGSRSVELLKLHGSVDWYDRYYHDKERKWHRKIGIGDSDPIFGPKALVRWEPLSPGPFLRRPPWEKRCGLVDRVARIPDIKRHFPIPNSRYASAPFLLPPAYDKLLGYDPIVDLWDSLQRRVLVFSSIVIIGYSMPQHDSHAYEGLGKLLIDYQNNKEIMISGQSRLPVQIVTLAESKGQALSSIPFLDPGEARIWYRGFSTDSLNWIKWGEDAE